MKTIDELYNNLTSAYENENLNKITGKIIELYQNRNFQEIRSIASTISEYVYIDEEKDSKCFSKLIVLYHPDKGETFREELDKHYSANNIEALNKYSHIFLLKDIENICVSKDDTNVDYQSESVWENERTEGDFFYDEDEIENEEYYDFENFEKSFYNELKLRLYGKLNVEFPPYYLEDFEDFEMAGCEMETLDGIQYCIHVITLDLTGNYLTDISELICLSKLEELYLANNDIGYIDSLNGLQELRIVDLSENEIDDISPLFELEKLEFVNLIGNPVPQKQIEKLKEKNILVIH
ncbi:MAG: leucine-rich repeat domain-containing protein [Melioribacteraceae bacterium]|nr:leucine-rich repeat domain-containing protein [Melioribacteraceae bacterium]